MNATEVLAKLQPVMDLKVRSLPSPKVLMGDESIALKPAHGKSIELSPRGIQSLLNYTQVPETLAKRLSPKTLGSVFQESLAQKTNTCLVMKEAHGETFLDATKYHPVNPERLVSTIARAIQEADFHRVLFPAPYTVQMEVVGVQEKPVSKGDLVRAGALIRFSPVGDVRPLVQSYAMRLVCTNGAVAQDVIKEYQYGHGGEGDNIWQWFRESIKEAHRSLSHIVQRWQQMMNENIPPEQRAFVLAALLKEAGITGAVAQAVQAWALADPPQNAYDMYNLITFATSHLIEDARRVAKAQQSIAHWAHEETHRHICPACRRTML